jgi:ABC-type Mn2+/Zn2+ transport system ATPase subunit
MHRQDVAGTQVAVLDRVCVRYGDVEALHDISLTIPRGVSVVVIGPNGSGKSTLLGVLSGLVAATSGRVLVLGDPPGQHHGHVAHVLQTTAVRSEVPMTVRETVRLGTYATLGLLRRPDDATRQRIDDAVRRLRLEDLLDRQLPELSGGQRQRVFLAQGLVQDADLLLLDEPLAGLDLPSQEIVAEVVRDERARGRTVLTTTHDIGTASDADLVLLIANDVVAFGSPDEVLTPEHLARAYGGHLHVLADGTLVLDDPAHHGALLRRPPSHHHADHSDHPHTAAQPTADAGSGDAEVPT